MSESSSPEVVPCWIQIQPMSHAIGRIVCFDRVSNSSLLCLWISQHQSEVSAVRVCNFELPLFLLCTILGNSYLLNSFNFVVMIFDSSLLNFNREVKLAIARPISLESFNVISFSLFKALPVGDSLSCLSPSIVMVPIEP